MKKLFFITSLILFIIFFVLITILSTIGIETDRFNKSISDRAIASNNNISFKLEKIKFKFDLKDINLFLETENPELIYREIGIPIKNAKVYLDFYALITSKLKINKINLSSKEINIDQLKKIIIKTKPSSLNSLITNKVKNGKLVINLELYFKDNLKIDNFIAKGEVKEMEGVINNDLNLKNTNFNFFADSSDILIKNVNSQMDGLLIKNGNLQIKKDQEINIQTDFLTEIRINKKNIIKFLPILKNFEFINKETNFNAKLDNFLNITFDKTFKVTDYVYTNKGKINKSFFKFNKPIENPILEKNINHLYLQDSNLNVRYASDKKNYVYSSGIYSTEGKNYQSYDFKNDFLKETFNINLNFEIAQKFKIDFINYEKKS
tara:strand:- start:788 stop:1921 length:1134 start_codon:yes stop_codon:yes gene_type:complete